MSQIEENAGESATQNAGTNHTQNERGTGVVTEGEHAFGFRFGALPVPVQLDCGSGAHRITADKAQRQGGPAGAVDPKQRHHDRIQPLTKISGQAEFDRKGGEDEKGEKGGHDDIDAQGQAALNSF